MEKNIDIIETKTSIRVLTKGLAIPNDMIIGNKYFIPLNGGHAISQYRGAGKKEYCFVFNGEFHEYDNLGNIYLIYN